MARLGVPITLIYHLFAVFTFFATPFFANTAAPVVLVSARELHKEQALARAQRRWDQRISDLGNSNLDPQLPLLGPFDPHDTASLFPTPTLRESHRLAASPSQTSVPSRTKSAPLNRITSSPGEYDDPSPLHRRHIEKRAVCPIVVQTTVYLFFSSGSQLPYSTTTVAGPRSTGIPGDDLNGLLNTLNFSDVPNTIQTANPNGGNDNGFHNVNPALLAGIFSILGIIVFAFVLAVWYQCRNRKARKLAAAGQVEERKDGQTVVREMGSKGFATLGSSTPPIQKRAFLHPGNMFDKALATLGPPKDMHDPRHSKASEDSELQDWSVNSGRIHRSVQWTELPPSSMQRESDFTGAQSDEMYPTMARDRMGTTGDEESSILNPIPASPSLDFQFPKHHPSALSVSELSDSPSAANPAFTDPRDPVCYETNVLYATRPDVLYGSGPSRSESAASSYAIPPTRTLLIEGRPLSQPLSNLTGATSVSTSVSPRRATTTTAATSVSPTFYNRTSGIQESPLRSVSPPLRDSREGASNPSALMAGFGLTPASQLEARTFGGAGQGVGTSSVTREGLFAPGGYGAGHSSLAVPGPSGSSSIPFPRESLQVLPIRRLLKHDEIMSRERQAREKERKMVSRRIVQLAMASPGALVSMESFSTDSQGVLDMHEGVESGSHPPVSIRPEHFRKDSLAATTETHQTRFSTKSYPYAGLIALHAPTARPLSVSTKAKSPVSFGDLSLSPETDYGTPFGAHSKHTSRAASFSSSQYLYGYPTANLDGESARGRSLSRSRRSSLSALSADPTSPRRLRNPSLSSSGRAAARASLGPTNKAEAAQRAAALIQLTSGARRARQVPIRSSTPPLPLP